MSLTTENPKSWSAQKFTVAVLWMEGRLGPIDIGKAVRWTPGQVRGFVNREFEPARVNMSREERQDILKFLKGWSGYFGVYIDARFEDRFHAKELRAERLERLQAEDRNKPEGERRELSKKELRKIAAEQAAQDRREEEGRLKREFGYAPRGAEVDAVGWLYLHALGDRNESVAKGAMMSRDRRREAILKFRVHLSGRSISPLQAQDYEAVGGGGGKKIALPEHRKLCIDMIAGIRSIMPSDVFRMLELVIEQDEFIWLRRPQGKARGDIFEAIRYGADILAVFYQMMSRDDFAGRWDQRLPETSTPSRSNARADSAAAQDIIDQLTKAVS